MTYDILIGASLLITLMAQISIKTSYNKYKKQHNSKNLTGFDVARQILDKNDLKDIIILEAQGELTDHYDPTKKVIKLSSDIYNNTSIASCAVAAHECGHAIQDKVNYAPMRIRSKLVPTVNLCTKLGYLAIVIGALFSYTLIEIGIILLLSMLVFQLVTLPVEFNASKRALKEIEKLNLINNDEKKYAKKMLVAAAFTYVASVLTTLIQILRIALMYTNKRR